MTLIIFISISIILLFWISCNKKYNKESNSERILREAQEALLNQRLENRWAPLNQARRRERASRLQPPEITIEDQSDQLNSHKRNDEDEQRD